jgi:hypothetical protein
MKDMLEQKIPASCLKVAEFSDKQQYTEATFWEKLRVRIHILRCKHCYTYHDKNEQLTALIKKHKFKLLSRSEKEDIKAKLNL